MKRHIVLFAALMVSMLPATGEGAELTYYVQSDKAQILSAPSFGSKVIAEVGKGRSLISNTSESSWIKVVYAGKEGYISSLLVALHPPLPKRGFIKTNDAEISQGVRRRSSYFSSAAAARGLTTEDRKRADTDLFVDYPALVKMEALSFSDDEVTRFMEGGKP